MNKLILSPIYLAPIFSVSAVLPVVDNKVKINKNSNISINENDYKQLIKMYIPYYNKLGVWDREKMPSDYSSSVYDKVGIIEVEDINSNYLLSQNSDFKIIRTNPYNSKSYSDHGYAVASIIGTDFGINQDASIYYTTLDNNKIIDSIINLHKNFGIRLINMSLGPADIFGQIGSRTANTLNSYKTDKKYDDVDNDYKMSLDDIYKYRSIFYNLSKAIIYFSLYDNMHIYGMNDIKKQYKAIGQYALDNNIKIIQSSGNDNDELSKTMVDNNLLNRPEFMDNGIISKQKIYDIFKKFFNSATKYWKNENYENYNKKTLAKIQPVIDNALGNQSWTYNGNDRWLRDFDFSDFLDIENRKKKLFNSLLDWQSLRYHDGIISVGSVNWKNIATNFSSYAKDNYGSFPFISAYGNDLKNDRDELSKNKYYKDDYDRIEKYIKTTNDSDEFKNKISYLFDFRGTSKSAPMITGLISRLQSKLKKELSIADVKLLLAGSANYSSTKAYKHKDFNFDQLTSEYEHWRHNRAKNKTGFGIPKYFKMKDIWNSDKIKTIRPHELGKDFINKKTESQVYADTAVQGQWKHWDSTFVWQQKMSFAKYWKLYNTKNNSFVSRFRNKWLPILLEAIEYNRAINPDWGFDHIPYFSIKADMTTHTYMSMYNSATETKLGNEPNVTIQKVYFYKPIPIWNETYKIFINYDELERYLRIFWDYLIWKNNVILSKDDPNYSYYYAEAPILQPYKKYIQEIKQKYWEHLKENVWIKNYANVVEVEPVPFW
ncbi:S8 family serine peptidase [Mycoplasmopsis bovis]|uniref:S8 family serine peptidase n=1 Tax=Mycoplasmopsis bovis TaxID=28903 RepID=UPI0024B8A2A6|nr:S8 family serine peptidase [Mycoplasmopsis bovis]WHO14764.1 S8 family serine peptidase [Mycoplasmopsis bovis]